MTVLLLLMMIGVAVHYMTFDRADVRDGLLSVAKLSHISSVARSVAYYEPRMPSDAKVNTSYPQMPVMNKMDFVYAEQ
jgi:hypothetical protein